jgi:predicted SnoaL-like aldol condensation-catalyzing enzyme
MPHTPGDAVRTWFNELWNKGDEATIDRLLHPDATIHGLPAPDGGPIRGPIEFKPFYRAFRAAFPDIRIELVHVLEQGDLGLGHCRVTGTQRGDLPGLQATNRRVDFSGFGMCRLEHGQVKESWNTFDFLTMYRQLGVELAPAGTSRTAGA